jgi:hypothetical protein
MLKTPDRTPRAVGVKTMLAVQLTPGAYEAPAAQVPTPPNPKSPVMLKALKIRPAFPVLVMVTVWTALLTPTFCFPNASDWDDKLTIGAGAGGGRVPVPESETTLGELGALVAMVTDPDLAPDEAGVKLKFKAQLAPGANGVEVEQLPEPEKPLLITKSEVNERDAVPLLVIVSV